MNSSQSGFFLTNMHDVFAKRKKETDILKVKLMNMPEVNNKKLNDKIEFKANEIVVITQ